MANLEHVEILKRGTKAWNEWRSNYKDVQPNLSGAIFINADLSSEYLRVTDIIPGSFNGPDLHGAVFRGADLRGADLSGAHLAGANFISADLRGADLRDTILMFANLSYADLRDVVLIRAILSTAVLSYARLDGADLTGAKLGSITFASNDLSRVKGLEAVEHYGPTDLGADTLYKSAGKIPEVFLRGCGVPEPLIMNLPALIAAMQPIQFYSCFISYSSQDQEFAEGLHADLQSKGVRVWFAPHDLPIGARIRPAIDESIRLHDKLLLVLSKTSVSSQWVEQEVETALEKEREQEGKVVLFPIRIDDAVIESHAGWPALLRNTRNVGDFTRWKDHDSYSKAFERLLRDLKAGA